MSFLIDEHRLISIILSTVHNLGRIAFNSMKLSEKKIFFQTFPSLSIIGICDGG